MGMSESDQPDSDMRPGSRPKPFQIDLNEAPLPSPREAASAGRKEHGAGFSCEFGVNVCSSCGNAGTADEGGMLLTCRGCGEESHRRCLSADNGGDLDCFKCLLGKNINKRMRRGVVHFDINASPPREADGEGFLGEVQRTGIGALDREREQKAIKLHPVPNISTISQSLLTAAIQQANFPRTDNGFLNKTYEVSHSLKAGFQPDVHNGLTRVEGFSANSTTFLPIRYPSKDPGELHFKYLADYIHEKGGTLGNGWHVEFIHHEKKPKAYAVYCAPDGSRFESMFEVACYLGLISNKTSFESFEGSDKYGPFQRGLHYNRRQTKSGKISRSQNCRGSSDSMQLDSDMDKSSGIEFNLSNILERTGGSTRAGSISNVGFAFQHFEDGCPLQFEDFFVLSAGKVDPRPSYHSSSQIWPIGYKSCWHDKLTGSLFLCEILDGGDSGPIFKIWRYSCSKYSIPIGSTILSRHKPEQKDGQGKVCENGLSAYEMVDCESTNLELILSEEASPSLADIDFEKVSFLAPEPSMGSNDLRLHDSIKEFSSEGRSASLAWETVLQTLLLAIQETFEKTGMLQFCCNHSLDLVSPRASESIDYSLSKFGNSWKSLVEIPHVIRSVPEFKIAFASLGKWLQEDRLGFNAEFVQEILEKLPGVNSLSEYIHLSKRSQYTKSQTVGNGFLHAKRTITFTPNSRRPSSHGESSRTKCFPLGKPLSSKLPVHLMGDVLQAWEFLSHFTVVLGLEEQFSFQELENELVNPWPDHNMADEVEKDIQNVDVTACTGISLRKAHSSLLKIVVGELLDKVSAYVDTSFEGGEHKSKRGKKKDADHVSNLKKAKFDLLQNNEITWPELARRYILLTLFTKGNLDSTEIIQHESGRIFRCLQGDGGTLCGSLTGVAGMEAEAKFLAEATKKIFGLMKKTDLVVSRNEEPDSGASQIIAVAGPSEEEPEWMQALEPVRKLPTNVGARIRKCVNEALSKNPPEWAKKIMEHSISKEIYKGNASGPTKRIIVSLLTDSGSKSIQPIRPEKKEKVKSVLTTSDLIMKKCRNVLRQAVGEDKGKVFCNLLGSTLVNPSDNVDEGTLGYLAMVSQPIDFRTVDMKLATGVYNGSHEAFLEDVQTVWYNVRKAYADQRNLIHLADKLSEKFADMFQKEVLALVQKIEEPRTNATSDGSHSSELEDMLLHASDSPLIEAPWEDGLCKVCGVDKDDDNVLLCDSCDSEYHTYCLNPPLARIPDGNWYCPSCAAKKNNSQGAVNNNSEMVSCSQKRIPQGPTYDFLKALAGLAKSMETKDYWELSLEERVFLLKYLCDESLNTSVLREHLEQCASTSADLQEKLRGISLDWKKEDLLARGNAMQTSVGVSTTEESNILRGDTRVSEGLRGSVSKSNQVLKAVPNILANGHQTVSEANGSVLTSLEMSTLKNGVSDIEDSIALIESELLSISVRKESLGKDSSDRVYWGFSGPRNPPFVAVNRVIEEQTPMKKLGGVSATWFCYHDAEIKELLGWLEDGSLCERELKESILQWQRNKLKESSHAGDNHVRIEKHSSFMQSRALSSLESKVGPFSNIQCEEKMYRCVCLELIWPFRSHCISCHRTFPNRGELEKHHELICSGSSPESVAKEDHKDKGKKVEKPVEKSRGKKEISKGSKSEKSEIVKFQSHPDCPFDLKEICRNFTTQNCLKELVSGLGFKDSGGIPKFVANDESPYLSDPSLKLPPSSSRGDENDLGLAKQGSALGTNIIDVAPRSEIPTRNKGGQRVDVRCIIPKSALRKLVGRVSNILRHLKVKLLDMDAALPEEAIRPSMASFEKRSTWRAFVKSASSIYQMVQATVMLEQMIKADYLKNEWWHWSSISAASSIGTLSSLSRRICSLDATMSYENLPSTAPTDSTTDCSKSVESDKSRPSKSNKRKKE
ncbi:methyl-CpG-binding domain-containing protein 9 [Impatiens glandulifera]|uniref:methyl-CpG-binding domain-containing protein 9 n=1 Tax=Impatiens glandulifera TaxID=253017 RepID=UPI001FB0B82B|nr:methyl-CpG-binding domain-containing protein 9 [Impatiens glandulifera]